MYYTICNLYYSTFYYALIIQISTYPYLSYNFIIFCPKLPTSITIH